MTFDRRVAPLVPVLFLLSACLGAQDREVREAQPELARLSTAVEQRLAASARVAEQVTEATVESLDTGTLGTNPVSIGGHMFDMLTQNPGLGAMRLADRVGNFMRVWREADGSISTRQILRSSYGEPQSRVTRRWPGGGVDTARDRRADPTDNYDHRGTDWFETGLATTKPVWLPWTAKDDAPGRVVVLSFMRQGEVAGVVAAEIGVPGFPAQVAELRPAPGWRVHLLGPSGNLLASSGAESQEDKLLAAVTTSPELGAVQGGKESGTGVVQAGGERAAFSLRRVVIAPDSHCIVAVVAPLGAPVTAGG